MADLSIEDLFPPEGHRYLDAAKIEALRQESMAVGVGGVIISAREAGEIVCDLTNGIAEVEKLTARLRLAEAVVDEARKVDEWVTVQSERGDVSAFGPLHMSLAALDGGE